MKTLKDIKEFNMLQRNLELTKALQDVDKLKAEIVKLQFDNEELSLRNKMDFERKKELEAENLALKKELEEWMDEIIEMPGVVVRPIDEDDESHYPSMEEEARNVLDEITQEEAERLKSKL